MNTVPDVDIRRGNEPQCFGLTATAIPEANGSQTGVSVGNAQSETKQSKVISRPQFHHLLLRPFQQEAGWQESPSRRPQ